MRLIACRWMAVHRGLEKGKKNAPALVTLQWMTDKNGYDYLKAFYELWQDQYPAINSFLLDLIIDDSELMEYSCDFTSGLRLDQVAGIYYISADIEVLLKNVIMCRMKLLFLVFLIC